MPPAAIPTLFPYTTLFRSVGVGANTALFSVFDRLILHPVTLPHPSSLVAIWSQNTQLNFNAPAVSWPRYEELDRKSTRLNSSHANISYAVFCLKKKTPTE